MCRGWPYSGEVDSRPSTRAVSRGELHDPEIAPVPSAGVGSSADRDGACRTNAGGLGDGVGARGSMRISESMARSSSPRSLAGRCRGPASKAQHDGGSGSQQSVTATLAPRRRAGPHRVLPGRLAQDLVDPPSGSTRRTSDAAELSGSCPTKPPPFAVLELWLSIFMTTGSLANAATSQKARCRSLPTPDNRPAISAELESGQ